jgi:hypothetical protein
MQVPVGALLDLYELVAPNRDKGHARQAIARAMRSQRRAAQRLRIDASDRHSTDDRHARARARALACQRAVAQRLGRPMVDEARHVLYRWRQQGRIDPRYAQRWEQALSRPLPAIRDALTDASPAGDDLRQNSPFAGLLSEPERQRILQEIS